MSDRILAATRKGLFFIDRDAGSRRWSVRSVSFLGLNVSMALHDPRDGALYAALDHGHFGVKLHRSRDGGATWPECPAPKYPPQPEGAAPDINPMSQKPIPWDLKLIWSLEAGGPAEPGV